MKRGKSFKIKIGRVVTEVSISGDMGNDETSDLFSGFITTERPDVRVYTRCIEDLRYDDYREPAPARLVKPGIYHIKWYYFSGEFNTRTGIARMDINTKPFVISSLLRIIYAIKMIEKKGLFVHASSFVRDGVAYLFAGKSGAGKTTLVKIATRSDREIQLLSDEISLITYERGEVFAYSTPFWGSTRIMGRYIKAPLRSIYFINKSKRTFTRQIDNTTAMQNILANILFASLDQESLSEGLKTAKNIITKAECRILNFQKNDSFLEVI